MITSICNLHTEHSGVTASFDKYTSLPLVTQRGQAHLQEQMISLEKVAKIFRSTNVRKEEK